MKLGQLHYLRVPFGPRTFSSDRHKVQFPNSPLPTFALARGHFASPPPADLLVACDSGGRPRAVFARDCGRRLVARIWPPYEARIRHRRERLCVRAAVTEDEVDKARAFIAANHPRGAARAGMLVTMRSLDEISDREPGRLIAAAQIGAFYHVSLPGRAEFAPRLVGPRLARFSRADLIQAIPIAAGVRFVVRADRRGVRLGDVLARQVLTVAANFRWPPARVVEVSRHSTAADFRALCDGARQDFLTRACYIPVPPPSKQIERNRYASAPDRQIATYYYADVSERPRAPGLEQALETRT